MTVVAPASWRLSSALEEETNPGRHPLVAPRLLFLPKFLLICYVWVKQAHFKNSLEMRRHCSTQVITNINQVFSNFHDFF